MFEKGVTLDAFSSKDLIIVHCEPRSPSRSRKGKLHAMVLKGGCFWWRRRRVGALNEDARGSVSCEK